MANRAEITGIDIEFPEKFLEFNPADKADFALSLNQIASNLAEIVKLLQLQTQTSGTLQLNVRNPNLFILAAMYYGDISLWDVIQDASMLSIPIITNLIGNNDGTEIKIPRHPKRAPTKAATR